MHNRGPSIVGSKRKFVTPNKTHKAGPSTGGYDRHAEGASLGGASRANLLNGTGHVKEQRMNWNKYPSETLPPSFFSTSNQVDVKITSAPVDYIDDFYFEITISNPNAANDMILVHPAYWFNRIECLLNGGQSEDQRFDDQLYLDYVLNLTDEQRMRGALGSNYNYDYTRLAHRYRNHSYDAPKDANFSIPAASSKTFRIRYKSIWHDARPFLPATMVETRFRIYSGQSQLQDPNSPAFGLLPPQILSLNALFYGPQFSSRVRESLTNAYRSRVSSSPCIAWERQILGMPNLNSGVETTDQVLTSLNGKFAALGAFLRPVGTVGVARYSDFDAGLANGASWKYFQNVTLNDSNGNPIGYTRTEGNFLYFNVFPHLVESAFTFEKNFCVIPFCSNLKAFMLRGIDSGSMMLDGSFTFRFTPLTDPVWPADNSIAANMNCELVIMGFRYAEVRQVPGDKGTSYKFVKY